VFIICVVSHLIQSDGEKSLGILWRPQNLHYSVCDEVENLNPAQSAIDLAEIRESDHYDMRSIVVLMGGTTIIRIRK
jgi:hypothetical protein